MGTEPKRVTLCDTGRELLLFIENDPTLHRRQTIPFRDNLTKKFNKGIYDHAKAPKLWQYLVDNGARKYCKYFGGTVRAVFPKHIREQVAQELANEWRIYGGLFTPEELE